MAIKSYAVTVVLALLLAACGGASDVNLSQLESVAARRSSRQAVDQSIKSIESAQRAISQSAGASAPGDALKLQEFLSSTFSVLKERQLALDTQLQAQDEAWRALRNEQSQLVRDKEKLELEQKILSAGLVASAIAAVSAITALLLKLPTLTLERVLMKLEIEEKRLVVEGLKTSPSETKPTVMATNEDESRTG